MKHSLERNIKSIPENKHSLHNVFEEKSDKMQDSIVRAVIDSSYDAIISHTLDGNITSWNPAATTMFGYTQAEVIGKHISLIIPSNSASGEDFIIQEIKKGKIIDYYETIGMAKDGSEKNIELSISLIRNDEGEISGLSKIARDISFKNEMEERKSTLAAIVDSSDDAIISKTIEGNITSWNKSAQKMFGYTEREVLGKHISLIIPKERLEEEDHIIKSIRSGKKVDHFETIRISKDGSTRNISLTVSPIKNSKGTIIGASKIARDISEKIEAENQRKLHTERLKELNQYKDEFMVMASHELKTPLTVILANLEILLMVMEEDPNSKFVQKTINQTLKLSKLINNLFEISKIQAGKLDLNFISFNIDELIEEIVGSLQGTTKTHQIYYPTKSGFSVEADRYKIEQVMINFIGNAIKYMTQPGDIIIEVERLDDQLLFSVKDAGVGIPAKDIEKIFERFYRVSGSASSFSGSGIGLYISAEIIKAHYGKIWAESELGKGSTFFFTIPLKQS